MVRSWNQLVGSAAELWAVLPSADGPSGLHPMARLRAVGEAIDIAEETGQLPTRAQAEAAAKPHLYHSVLGVDLQKALGTATGVPPVAEPVDLESEAETMRGELFRANSPPPKPVPESEPAVAVEAAPVPAVTKDVEDAARQLAEQVHSSSAKPRTQLFRPGLNPSDEAAYSAHAVAMQWLVVEGEWVHPGPVHPQPRTTTLIPN
jgi:hypothetical protein